MQTVRCKSGESWLDETLEEVRRRNKGLGQEEPDTNLGLANVEVLVAVVDDVVLRSARPDETQTLKQTKK